MNSNNKKYQFKKFKPWRKDDSSEGEKDESFEEQEDFDVEDFTSLLKELLDICKKLSTQLPSV